jgi:hypothetical protein
MRGLVLFIAMIGVLGCEPPRDGGGAKQDAPGANRRNEGLRFSVPILPPLSPPREDDFDDSRQEACGDEEFRRQLFK